ncbi:beta-galactosidase BgaS [Cuniculiplasma sp. SKW3]|uniref:beta-galactosidase BgaS n=1 Tax=Cuniculiplasma sp. SKW3 TaxID=3400170 RepID=UPI003FD31E44
MFPKDFKFGFSEAGFQFEMGLSHVDANSDWFIWSHDQKNIEKHYVSGDLPENGPAYWDLYKKDHDYAQFMGMNSARIGIEWSRIFPQSTEDIKVDVEKEGDAIRKIVINREAMKQLAERADKYGVQHYSEIFKDLKERGFYLVINLYHWTIPKWLNDPSLISGKDKEWAIGGCFDERITIEFAKYAAFIGKTFDSLADRWSTMNEPNMVFQGCSRDFSRGGFSRRKRNFAQAHARAYDALRQYSSKDVGIIYANGDFQPMDGKDMELKNMVEFQMRYSFFDAIVKGDLSWYNKDIEGDERFSKDPDIRDDMKGHLDWIGVNYYSRDVVERSSDPSGWRIVLGLGHATGEGKKSKDGRSTSDTGWEIYPEGIYNVLMSYHNRYHMRMMVTENGMADAIDQYRPKYVVSHLYNVERAIKDGARVEGYFHWALTDNYEWGNGFSKRFGLIGVNLETKERELRPSALVMKHIIENHGVPDDMMWMANLKI